MDLEPVIEEKYHGYVIKIYQEENPQNPRTEWDNFGKMICFHNNYDLGDKSSMSAEELKRRKTMPICPHCKKELDRLDAVVAERNVKTLHRGDHAWDLGENIESNVEHWQCSYCYKIIHIDNPDALCDEDLGLEFLGIKTVTTVHKTVERPRTKRSAPRASICGLS